MRRDLDARIPDCHTFAIRLEQAIREIDNASSCAEDTQVVVRPSGGDVLTFEHDFPSFTMVAARSATACPDRHVNVCARTKAPTLRITPPSRGILAGALTALAVFFVGATVILLTQHANAPSTGTDAEVPTVTAH